MSLRGVVESTEVDEVGCGFATVAVTLSVDGDVKTTCTARIALPADPRRQSRGLAVVTNGDPRPRPRDTSPPTPCDHERGAACWTLNSTRSRSCCARRCATCWRGTARSSVVRQMEDDPVGYPASLWAQLGELDLIGLLLPEEYGGSAMSLIEGVALYEELGRALAPTPHFVSAVMSGGVLAGGGKRRPEGALAPPGRRRSRRSSRRPGSSPRTGSRPAASRRGPWPRARGSGSRV